MAVSSGSDIKLKVLIDYDTQGGVPLRDVDGGIKSIHKSSSGLSSVFGEMGGLISGAFTASSIVAVGAALLDVVDGASKVDKGVREIGTLMGGLSDGEIKRMKEELSALSITSGQAMDSLVKARYDIVSSGFTDAADSALILEQSAKLAVGGVTEVSTAADVLTTVISAYGLTAEEVGVVSDDLFTIVKLGKTTMDDLGSQFGVLAAVAAPAGVSVDEAGAALAALTVQGQSTSVSVTGISAAIMELQKPSKDMITALRSIGVESDNLIKTGGGLEGALKLVERASEASGISINKLFTREEALRAIMPLTGTAAKAFSDDLKEMGNNAGATDTAFNQMAQSSDFLQKQAWAAFESVKNKIGDAIINSDLFKGALIGAKDSLISLGGASGVLDQPIEKMSDLDRGLRTAWLVVESLGLGFVELGKTVWGAFVKIHEVSDALTFGLAPAVRGFFNDLGLQYEDYMLKADQARKASEWMNNTAQGRSTALSIMSGGGTDQIAQFQKLTESITKQAEEFKKHKPAVEGSTGAIVKGGAAADKHAKSAEDAARKNAAWSDALDDSREALSGNSKETMTLAQAEDRVVQAFHAALVSQGWSKDRTKEMTAATKEYNAAKDYQGKLEKEIKGALDDAEKALTLGTEKTLTVAEATKKYGDEVVALTAEIAINKKAETANGESKERLREKTEAVTDAHKGQTDAIKATADAYDEQTTRIAHAVTSIGTAFEAATGTSIKGLDTLSSAIKEFSATNADGTDKKNRTESGILGITNAVGQMIGGSTGSAISGGASGAMTGLSIGGPVGAVIGGVIGFGLSLLSSSQAEKDQRTADRMSAYDAILQSGLNGGPTSAALLAAGGYNFSGVAALQDANPLKTIDGMYHVNDPGNRLLGDSRNWSGGAQEITDLMSVISVMDTVGATINSLASSGVTNTLRDIGIKYDYMIAQAVNLAGVEEARFRELAAALLGMTVDNISGVFEAAMASTSVEAGVAALKKNVQESLNAAIRSILIQRTVEDVMMPILDPVLKSMTSSIASGAEMSADNLLDLGSQVSNISELMTPVFSTLYTLIDSVGMLPAAVQSATKEMSSLAVSSSGNIVSAMDTTVSTIESMSSLNASTEAQQARIISLLETMLGVDGDNKVLLGRVSNILDRVSVGGSSIRTMVVTG